MRQPSGLRSCAARELRQQVEQAVAVVGREGIEIDQLADALTRAVGDAGRDHAAIGMADQVDAGEILEFQHAENVGDVRLEIDIGIGEMARARRGRYRSA